MRNLVRATPIYLESRPCEAFTTPSRQRKHRATDGVGIMLDQMRVADTMIHLIGVGVAVGFYRALSARLRPFDEVFGEGREVGYNRGYWEGRREGRPVVVPMACPDCGRQRRSG